MIKYEIVVNSSRKVLVLVAKQECTYEQLMTMACHKLKCKPKHCRLYLRGERIAEVSELAPRDDDPFWLLVGEREVYQGPEPPTTPSLAVSIVANEDVEIDPEAVHQLNALVRSSGETIVRAVGMPDLHHGPTGVAILAKAPMPAIPGYDIGCGMSLFATTIPASIPHDKVVRRMARINIDVGENSSDPYLGTLGGGNHFAELLRIDEAVPLDDAVVQLLTPDRLYLLVHSGSRGHGKQVFQDYMHVHRDVNLYMAEHERLIRWAKLNRRTIAARFLGQFNNLPEELAEPLIDIAHNYIERTAELYLHRKGAAPADGLSLLPGSRGTASYVLLGHGRVEQLCSLAHGAGRRVSRTDARKIRAEGDGDLTNGGTIICKNPDLLYEEAPFAYKDVEGVVGCMQAYDMCTIASRMLPVATYKTATC